MFDKLKEELEKFVADNIPKKWRLTVGIIIFIILPIAFFLFWNWQDFLNKPLSVWVLDKYENIKYPIPKPIPRQFNIAIAKLENDDNNKIRQELGKNLQNFATKFNNLGTKEIRSIYIESIPLRIDLDDEMSRDSVQKGHKDALIFLSKYDYDVVIWGNVGKNEVSPPSLFWTTFAHQDPYHNIDNNEEKLPSIAIQDLTVVLAALITTRGELYAYIKDQDITDKIRIFIEELKNLIEISGNKKGWDEMAYWQIKRVLANSLKILGQASESTKELEEAIKLYEKLLNSEISNNDLFEKAEIEDSYATTLAQLGIRSRVKAESYLTKAEIAHLAALSLLAKEKTPWNWARVQNNLANTQFILGKYDDAEKAFNSALEVWAKDKYPVDWATVQNNLSGLFIKNDDISLNKAIQHCRQALTIRTKDRYPLDYAFTQDNLGNALRKLGERQRNTAYLFEAVESHKKALAILTKENSPWEWAKAKNNLGETLIKLSEQDNKLQYLEEANQAFMDALTVRTQENFPRVWADTLNDWGIVLSKLGERLSDENHLQFNKIYFKQSIMAFSAASTIRTEEIHPMGLSPAKQNLKKALSLLKRAELMNDCQEIAQSTYYSTLPQILASSDSERFDSKFWLDKLNRKIISGMKKCKYHIQFDVAR